MAVDAKWNALNCCGDANRCNPGQIAGPCGDVNAPRGGPTPRIRVPTDFSVKQEAPVELPVTEEMVAAGRAVYEDTQAWMNGTFEVGLARFYRAMAAVAPTSYDECTVTALRSELDAALRDRDSWASKCGEATERALRAEGLLRDAQSYDPPWAAEVVPLTRFVELGAERDVIQKKYDLALQRLAERDVSLLRATGRRG